MNGYHDPELEDVLQDDELMRIATLLASARLPEPPLDDAFRTGLRRQLMQQAWTMAEGRDSWWRRAFAPPGLAWAGAAVGVILIAAVVIALAGQGSGSPFQVTVSSNLDGSRGVALQQPILVNFNQPMDHASTEAAVQITPATTVAYSWEGNTLAVTPTSGNLAPNTQYQVTIGSGAKTASQQTLAQSQTITFVTQPAAAPTPPPSPRPTPASASLLTGEKQIATIGTGAAVSVQWAADSSAVYFIDANGGLDVVPAKGGTPTVIAQNGASSPAISHAGDRLAYIRGGKIEVLTFASGKTDELAVNPAPTLLGWSQTQLEWVAGGMVFNQPATSPKQIGTLPSTGTVTALSISPDGSHVAYTQDQGLFLKDLVSGKSVQLGAPGATFAGWSAGSSYILYATASSVVVADQAGHNQATLPSGDAAWSSQDAILLGTDVDLTQVRPDGSALTRLSTGTYHSPAWAPNGASFTFVRGNGLWVASAPPLPAAPTPLDLASSAVTSFMDSRVKGLGDQATTYLDASGKQDYAAHGMNLVISGDPHLTRYYVLTSEMVSTDPQTARVIVRLVLTHGKLDVSEFEETLTLVRDPTTQQFVIDAATAGTRHELGKGAEVVGVDISSGTLKLTFDSDLDPGTVSGGVLLLDAKGMPVEATSAYANRVVTFSGLDLSSGVKYRLVVLPTVRDVAGRNVSAEYDLDLLGPAANRNPDQKPAVTPSVSPSPSASPSPSGSPAH